MFSEECDAVQFVQGGGIQTVLSLNCTHQNNLIQVAERFEKLAKLHVNKITINSWEEVSKLRWFPALADVRMVHWDLFGVSHGHLAQSVTVVFAK